MKIKFNEGDFTYINREVIDSIRNVEAGAVLAYMCSFPDKTIFDFFSVRKHFNMSITKLEKALIYLQKQNYIFWDGENSFSLINE